MVERLLDSTEEDARAIDPRLHLLNTEARDAREAVTNIVWMKRVSKRTGALTSVSTPRARRQRFADRS